MALVALMVDGPSFGKLGCGDGEFNMPTALAVVPGLGLVVQECHNQRLQVFVTPDAIAMASMPLVRVGWMTAVVRAVLRRRGICGQWTVVVQVEDGGRPKRALAPAM
jgi:hypothetical protein